MEIALISLAILLFLCSTWFVLHYAKRSTSVFIILLSIISFGSGLAAVPLLPIDLSYASATVGSNSTTNVDDASIQSDDISGSNDTTIDNPTYVPWQLTYWTTFLLAWFILPITRETLHSGRFSLLSQVKEGISSSLRGICLMIVVGIVFVIGMAIHMHSVRLISVLMPVLMAWGNTYGLVLVSLLLGNGLVSIPQKYWREAHPDNELRRIRIVACGAEEELFDAVMGLEDVERKIEDVCAVVVQDDDENDLDEGAVEVISRRRGKLNIKLCSSRDDATQFNECLESLVKRKNETLELNADRRTERTNGGLDQTSSLRSDDMDIKYLVELNAQLKKAQERVTSAQLRWDYLIQQHRTFSALTDEGTENISSIASSGRSEERPSSSLLSPASTHSSSCIRLRTIIERLWIKHLRYYSYRFCSIISATLSIFVVMGEVTLAAPINLSPFSWILHAMDENNNTVLFQIAALIPLLYMSICIYACLFQMSLLGPYRLRGNMQSHGVALVFNAQFLVRLQFPLAYNFLLILKYDTTSCAFHSIMSDMSTIPFFGTSFTVYAPLLILAVCAFTLCDAYPKLLHVLGIDHEDTLLLEDRETLDSRVNEGIQLLKRESDKRSNEPGESLRGSDVNITISSGSPDKIALVPSRSIEIDDTFNMDGCCRGRYSDGDNSLV